MKHGRIQKIPSAGRWGVDIFTVINILHRGLYEPHLRINCFSMGVGGNIPVATCDFQGWGGGGGGGV